MPPARELITGVPALEPVLGLLALTLASCVLALAVALWNAAPQIGIVAAGPRISIWCVINIWVPGTRIRIGAPGFVSVSGVEHPSHQFQGAQPHILAIIMPHNAPGETPQGQVISNGKWLVIRTDDKWT